MSHSLYTLQHLLSAAESSLNLGEILSKLGLRNHTSYRNIVKRDMISSGIWTNTVNYSMKAKSPTARSVQDYLDNKFPISGNSLKIKLLKLNIFERACAICGLADWQNQPLTLQMDHVDGNRLNNNLDNLRLLCPNCHSQTITFSTKRFRKPTNHCKQCNAEISYKSLYCYKHASLNKDSFKIKWPSIKELIIAIESSTYVKVGTELGVSGNAVRKHLARNGVDCKSVRSHRRLKLTQENSTC